ncbi:uncharacterized protein LOC117334756 [Pecten maximus]|uniref:uncharacterized protein LOC117334756 n=1 Tax=Pecten maximus TaxID=6579 RepID=UPI0014591025|nr:uncharacterized protein LOC117334756 [Pecten maximus]
MAAVMTRREVGVRDVGSTVHVPDDVKAKLMFYLKCICDLINLEERDEDMNRLTDYRRYYLLTETEIDQLTIMCLLLSPSLLTDKCIFHNEEMCGDSRNKFFEISSVNRQLLVSNNIMIGGTQTRVNRIMCFKMEWMVENYFIPILILKSRLELKMQIAEEIVASHQRQEAADDCCCTIL